MHVVLLARCCVFVPRGGGSVAAAGDGGAIRALADAVTPVRSSATAPILGVALFIASRSIPVEIALHLRRAQQLLDPFGFVEPIVDAEADVGREFEIDPMGDLAAQIAFVAFERGEHGCLRRWPPSGMT